MINVTHTTQDICHLNYLVGTLATAYKGVIKSLVVKDFCITDSGATTMVKGAVLAMPPGNYEASLNKSGVELSRVDLQQGTSWGQVHTIAQGNFGDVVSYVA